MNPSDASSIRWPAVGIYIICRVSYGHYTSDDPCHNSCSPTPNAAQTDMDRLGSPHFWRVWIFVSIASSPGCQGNDHWASGELMNATASTVRMFECVVFVSTAKIYCLLYHIMQSLSSFTVPSATRRRNQQRPSSMRMVGITSGMKTRWLVLFQAV